MSIDARITAVERNSDGTALIKLEPLPPTGGPAGQCLLVLNAPAFFEAAVGTEIHADTHIVRVQGKRWAERIGCTKLRLVCLALLLWTAPAWAQDAPPPIVLGPTTPPPHPANATIIVLPGRFLPITPGDGSPSYIAPSPAYRVYKVPSGSFYTGIKYDAPLGAEAESYSWPDVKTPVYCILARDLPGQYPIQLVKNGPVDVGPVENGSALLMQIGPRPPPPDPPIPPPIPPPVDPFQTALQAAYNLETAPDKANQVKILANFYRAAATTTVNNVTLKTTQDLQDTLKIAVKQIGLPSGALSKVVAVIAQDIIRTFPSPTTALDQTTRSAAASEFIRVATALEGLK